MMSHLTSGYELTFKDICIEIEKKEILKLINGLAHPGEMLAVMGPSGELIYGNISYNQKFQLAKILSC